MSRSNCVPPSAAPCSSLCYRCTLAPKQSAAVISFDLSFCYSIDAQLLESILRSFKRTAGLSYDNAPNCAVKQRGLGMHAHTLSRAPVFFRSSLICSAHIDRFVDLRARLLLANLLAAVFPSFLTVWKCWTSATCALSLR